MPSKPLTPAQIGQLRVLLKKAARLPPRTKAEQAAHASRTKSAKLVEYKATALAYVQNHWDTRAVALRAQHGERCPVELGIGDRPKVYDHQIGNRYKYLRTRTDITTT